MRPKDEKEVGLLKRKDPYGHYKLSCEEALSYYQREKAGFPWVSLRLADVIGARDTTNRSALTGTSQIVRSTLDIQGGGLINSGSSSSLR